MSNSMKTKVGKRVESYRIDAGISKSKFALMVGISRPYLNAIESGIGNPSLDVLTRIAEGLDIELCDLFK